MQINSYETMLFIGVTSSGGFTGSVSRNFPTGGWTKGSGDGSPPEAEAKCEISAGLQILTFSVEKLGFNEYRNRAMGSFVQTHNAKLFRRLNGMLNPLICPLGTPVMLLYCFYYTFCCHCTSAEHTCLNLSCSLPRVASSTAVNPQVRHLGFS